MSVRFTVLASGSTGNASLFDVEGYRFLLDFGLGPRKLTRALERAGCSLQDIRCALLTHLHNDHWRERTLADFVAAGVTLWCHAEHQRSLRQQSATFKQLESANLVRCFDVGQSFACGACRAEAFAVEHDTFTCGFRLEGADWAVGFASDLGSWTPSVLDKLVDADLLALEFNHDVAMQLGSGRHPWLIRRNLGGGGHLSNAQAARLLDDVLERSAPGRLRHLVALHLSRQCNRPELALAAAHRVRAARGATFGVRAAAPHHPLPWIDLTEKPQTTRYVETWPRRRAAARRGNIHQPLFPGWE